MAGLTSASGQAMLENGNFSDFKITSSDFFRAAVGKDFKEGVSGVLDFPEEHSIIVALALLFIYSGKFNDDPESNHSAIWRPRLDTPDTQDRSEPNPDPTSSMDICSETFAFADQYGLNRLRDTAYNQFMTRAVEGFTTVEFKDALQKIYENSSRDALQKIYENSSRDAAGLRLAVTRLCITKHKIVKEHAQLLAVIQAHEPMAFRCGLQSIKDEDLGECYHHKDQLLTLERRVRQLTTALDGKNACDECGAHFAVRINDRKLGGYDLLCTDCGERWDYI